MSKMYSKNILKAKNAAVRQNGGFTLIELLVVVLIIGILAGIAVPMYQKAVRKARATEYITWVRRIVDAEQEFFMANGRYTGNIEELNIDYKHRWPTISTDESSTRSPNLGDLFIWTYGGYILRVMVGEPITKHGGDFGGYGAQLHAKNPSQNYPLVCAEYACHGVSPGSYCKNFAGATGEPVVNGSYCFRFYELP